MGLRGRIAQVVVVSARSGIGAVQNRVNRAETVRLLVHLADLCELTSQPHAIVKREVDGVQVGAPADGNGPVALDTELHADALVKCFGQLEPTICNNQDAGSEFASLRAAVESTMPSTAAPVAHAAGK